MTRDAQAASGVQHIFRIITGLPYRILYRQLYSNSSPANLVPLSSSLFPSQILAHLPRWAFLAPTILAWQCARVGAWSDSDLTLQAEKLDPRYSTDHANETVVLASGQSFVTRRCVVPNILLTITLSIFGRGTRFHNLIAWLSGRFIVMDMYLTELLFDTPRKARLVTVPARASIVICTLNFATFCSRNPRGTSNGQSSGTCPTKRQDG